MSSIVSRQTPLESPSPCAAHRPARWRRGLLLIALVLSLLVVGPSTAVAGTAGKKLGRGAVNLSLGVLALPGQVYKTTRENGPFIGLTWGVVKGVGWMVATEAIGLFEVVTCPFETPPDFEPILDPVYPWGHFQQER